MEKILHYCILFLCLLSFDSCKDKETVEPVLEVEPQVLNFLKNKDAQKVTIRCHREDWTAELTGATENFCSVVKAADNITVVVEANPGAKERTCSIRIATPDGLEKSIQVTQAGSDPVLLIDKTSPTTLKYDAIELIVNVTTNIEFDVEVSDNTMVNWSMDKTSSPAIKFSFAANEGITDLSAKITFKGVMQFSTTKTELVLVQKSMTASADDIETPQDEYVAPSSGSHSEAQPGAGIEKSYDRDLSTSYHSIWSQTANFPVILTYNFVDKEAIDYILYYPPTNGNGNFGEFELWIQANGAPALEKYGDYDFKKTDTPGKINLDQVKNPVKVEFRVKTGNNNFVACREMEFWKRAPENEDRELLQVFTDRSFSELKAGATDAQIDQLPSFYRIIARKLKAGVYPSEFRIQSYPPYTVPEIWARTNMTKNYGKLDNCTGIYAEAGQEIVVFLDDRHGLDIALASVAGGSYDMDIFYLRAGANKLTMTRSGLLYVMYHTENLSLPPVKVHIAEGSGIVNGYWDAARHTDADYLRLIDLSDKPYFDMKTKNVMLTFRKAEVKSAAPSAIAPIMQVWDSIVYYEFNLMGYHKYPRQQNNRIYGISYDGEGYMSATDYRTNYNNNTLSWIMNASKMKGTNINPDHLWGPCHEIGHVNQLAINWQGMAEASNNLFSNMMLHKFKVSDKGGWRATCQENFDAYYVSDGKPHADGTLQNRTSVQFQLYLYFHALGINKDFYPDLFERMRTTARWGSSEGTRQLNFAIKCCEAARLDLTEFFEAWGFFRTIDKAIDDYGTVQFTITAQNITDAKNYIKNLGYPKPQHAIQYLLDERDTQNFAKYRNNLQLPDNAGASRSGGQFTVSNGANAVAFEVEADGKVIYVTNKTNFWVDESRLNGAIKVYAVQAGNTRKLLN